MKYTKKLYSRVKYWLKKGIFYSTFLFSFILLLGCIEYQSHMKLAIKDSDPQKDSIWEGGTQNTQALSLDSPECQSTDLMSLGAFFP